MSDDSQSDQERDRQRGKTGLATLIERYPMLPTLAIVIGGLGFIILIQLRC